MGLKIHEYPNEAFIINDEDFYDVDYWNGTAFQSHKISGATLKSLFTALVSNVYNSDGLLTGDRTLTGDNFLLFFQELGQFKVHSHKNNIDNVIFEVRSQLGFESFTVRDHITNDHLFCIENGKVQISNAYNLPTTDGISGQVLTTDGLGQTSFQNIPAPTNPEGWTTIVKSANQDVVNNATLQDDTELQFSVVANAHYMVEMDVVISASDAATAKFKHSLTLSSGTQKGSGNAISNSNAGAGAVIGFFAFNTASASTQSIATFVGDVNAGLFSLKIIYSFLPSANGIFKYQFANSVAVAGATSRVWKGSILKYKRID